MSTPDSTRTAESSTATPGTSLAARAEARFFTLDHVGVVKHYEGIDMKVLVPAVRAILEQRSANYEDALEEFRGRIVYTNIANFDALSLWLNAALVKGVGVIVDAKLFHSSTEQSAEADEKLSSLVGELEEKVRG